MNIKPRIEKIKIDFPNWPSDHPLILSKTKNCVSWNLEMQISESTGKYFNNIKFYETNNAYSKRIAIALNILLRLQDFNIIALQEVETEFVLKMATSELSKTYDILFETDPEKPRGHAILCKKDVINIVNVSNECYLVNTENTDAIVTLIYNGTEVYYKFPNSFRTLTSVQETFDKTAKLVGFPLIYELRNRSEVATDATEENPVAEDLVAVEAARELNFILSVHIPINTNIFPKLRQMDIYLDKIIIQTGYNITLYNLDGKIIKGADISNFCVLGDFNHSKYNFDQGNEQVDNIITKKSDSEWESVIDIKYIITRYIYFNDDDLVKKLVKGYPFEHIEREDILNNILSCDGYRYSFIKLKEDIFEELGGKQEVNIDNILDLFLGFSFPPSPLQKGIKNIKRAKVTNRRLFYIQQHITRFADVFSAVCDLFEDKEVFRIMFKVSYSELKSNDWFEKRYGRNSFERNIQRNETNDDAGMGRRGMEERGMEDDDAGDNWEDDAQKIEGDYVQKIEGYGDLEDWEVAADADADDDRAAEYILALETGGVARYSTTTDVPVEKNDDGGGGGETKGDDGGGETNEDEVISCWKTRTKGVATGVAAGVAASFVATGGFLSYKIVYS